MKSKSHINATFEGRIPSTKNPSSSVKRQRKSLIKSHNMKSIVRKSIIETDHH